MKFFYKEAAFWNEYCIVIGMDSNAASTIFLILNVLFKIFMDLIFTSLQKEMIQTSH